MTQYVNDANLSAQEILDTPMFPHNDAGASTIRDYLKRLLSDLWQEGEGFDSKRPFGNSGWEMELYQALEDRGFDPEEVADMNAAIFCAIEAL